MYYAATVCVPRVAVSASQASKQASKQSTACLAGSYGREASILSYYRTGS